MPSKKKKYNARFPPARIKKIMQTDEEVGKVAAAVPVIISRALELFVESLVKNASLVTTSRNAKTLTTSHIKACVLADENFKFLKTLVQDIPDVTCEEETLNPGTVPVLEGQPPVQNSIHQNCARRGRPPKVKTNESDGAGPSHSTAEESEVWSAEDDDDDEESTESGSEPTSNRVASSSLSIPPTFNPSYGPGALHNFHSHHVACNTTSSADEDYDL